MKYSANSRNIHLLGPRGISLILLVGFLFIGCQEFFTYSLFEGLQRDPADLPAEQQISYARSALAAGDVDAMADIYDEIVGLAADGNDPELYLLAADLAMGASGLTDVIADVLTDDDPGTLDYTVVLAGLDTAMLGNVSVQVLAAEGAGGTPTTEQYLTAAGAELLGLLEGGGTLPADWSAVTADPAGSADQKALYFLQQAGEDPEAFDDIFGE